jgi:hypothetical protein
MEEKALKEQVKANKSLEGEQKNANKAQLKADEVLATELAKATFPTFLVEDERKRRQTRAYEKFNNLYTSQYNL